MEASINQHVLTFSKGICNLSPDLTCPDDELQDCLGLTYHDEALRPIQCMSVKLELSDAYPNYRLVMVHEISSGEQIYIFEKNGILFYYDKDTNSMVAFPTEIAEVTEVPDSSSEEEPTGSQTKLYIRYKEEANYGTWSTYYIKADSTPASTITVLVDHYYPAHYDLDGTLIPESTKTLGWELNSDGWLEVTYGQFPTGAKRTNLRIYPKWDDKYIYELVEDETISINKSTTKSARKTKQRRVGTKTENISVSSAKSVGNIVVINLVDGLAYYLWSIEYNSYKYLGNSLPEPNVALSLETNGDSYMDDPFNYLGDFLPYAVSDTIEEWSYDEKGGRISGNQPFADAVIGVYAKLKKQIAARNYFCSPFFVRVALELYDGSYAMIGAPELMLPSIHNTVCFVPNSDNNYITAMSVCGRLRYNCYSDYSFWSDIVKKIVVFVSKPIELHNTSDHYSADKETSVFDRINQGVYETYSHDNYPILPVRDISEINEELATSSVYYKIAEIPTSINSNITGSTAERDIIASIILPIKENVITNLTTQSTLVDSTNGEDYFGHTRYLPSFIETFNRRLNMANIKRTFFDGFYHYFNYGCKYGKSISSHKYRLFVWVHSSSGVRVIKKEFETAQLLGSWFYYPDTRAKKFSLYYYDDSKSIWILQIDKQMLTEHPGLNGVYYFSGLTNLILEQSGTEVSESSMPDENSDPETLQNYLLQSQVDNPFTFQASGYVRVGQGNIIGIAALTTALNQDAYKVATTIVFTSQGIWALKINDEGEYSSVTPPFSREVCINADTITMVDNGVFFVSEKGLMLITDNGIQCVSQQLSGKNPANTDGTAVYDSFIDFAKDCIMAYDYRDSQLWLVNNKTVLDAYEVPYYKYDYHWVYNMKTGTFSRMKDGKHYISVVTDYPDTLCQDNSYNINSMIKKPNINDDTTLYGCSFVTRPLKLDGSIFLKSLRQLKHLISLNPDASFEFKIEGSNDLEDWINVSSLRGKPYKFFRLHYELKNLSATDTVSGLILQTQKRYTEKLI